MSVNLEIIVPEQCIPANGLDTVNLFGIDVRVVQSCYDNHQIRIDLYSEYARQSRHPMFDAFGKWEVTTATPMLLTKQPYSWIDLERPHMREAFSKLLEIDAFSSSEQACRRLPPYGQVLQRVRYNRSGALRSMSH